MRRPATVHDQARTASSALLSRNNKRPPTTATTRRPAGDELSEKISSARRAKGASALPPSTLSTTNFIGQGCNATKAEAVTVSAKIKTKNRRCGRAYANKVRYLNMARLNNGPNLLKVHSKGRIGNEESLQTSV